MRSVIVVILLLLAFAFIPLVGGASGQGPSQVYVKSLYTLNRYGYATINESVRIVNNGTSSIQFPSIDMGFGNLSADVVATTITPGFSVGSSPSPGGPFTVASSQPIQGGSNATFTLSLLVDNVVSTAKNGSLQVLTLSSPSLNLEVNRIVDIVQMPLSTAFSSPPTGLTASISGTNNTYSSTSRNEVPRAVTSVRAISQSAVEDFNPLHIFGAVRTISVSPNGLPLVTDEIRFENLGTIPLTQIYVSMLAPLTTTVTMLTARSTEPVLISPFKETPSSGALDLSNFVAGYPTNGVQPGTNLTLRYQYPLGTTYYSVSGGQVSIKIPDAPPVSAFVDSYNITISLPRTARAVQTAPVMLRSVTPWQTGSTQFAYSLSAGWFIEGGIPVASVMFILLLIGLFVARTSMGAEEERKEEEEESSSQQATGMINAFDEKTDLINSLWQEIEGKDPNDIDKAYFDELRGRLDVFRSKALARLNEVRQKATSQKFSEVVNQIQSTEREVDRAARDKLNLYQQYYLKQMRKDVFDRLLPQYSKRLERALNQLSDELHTVQREAKLL